MDSDEPVLAAAPPSSARKRGRELLCSDFVAAPRARNTSPCTLPLCSVLDIAEMSMQLGVKLLQMSQQMMLAYNDTMDAAIAMFALSNATLFIHPDGTFPLRTAPVLVGELQIRTCRSNNTQWKVPLILELRPSHSNPLLNFNSRTTDEPIPIAMCVNPAVTALTVNMFHQPNSTSRSSLVCILTDPDPAAAPETGIEITVTGRGGAGQGTVTDPAGASPLQFDGCAFKVVARILQKSMCCEDADGREDSPMNLFVVADDLLNKRTEFMPLHVAFQRIRKTIRHIMIESRTQFTTTGGLASYAEVNRVIVSTISRMMTRGYVPDLPMVRGAGDAGAGAGAGVAGAGVAGVTGAGVAGSLWNADLRPAFVPAPPKCYLADMELDLMRSDPLYVGMANVPSIRLFTTGASAWFCNRCSIICKNTTTSGTIHLALDSLISMFAAQAGLRWQRNADSSSMAVFGKHPMSVKFMKHTFLHVPCDPSSAAHYRPACPFGCYLIKDWRADNPQGSGNDATLEDRIDSMVMHGSIRSQDVVHMATQVNDRLCGPLYVLLRSSCLNTVTTARQADRLVDGGWALYSYLRWACSTMTKLFSSSHSAESNSTLLFEPVLVDLEQPLAIIDDTASPSAMFDAGMSLPSGRLKVARCKVCCEGKCVCGLGVVDMNHSRGRKVQVVLDPETGIFKVDYGMAVSSRRPEPLETLDRVIANSLNPRCPSCQAHYVLSEGCTHIHCPECGNHHCFTCGRQFPRTKLPSSGREMVRLIQSHFGSQTRAGGAGRGVGAALAGVAGAGGGGGVAGAGGGVAGAAGGGVAGAGGAAGGAGGGAAGGGVAGAGEAGVAGGVAGAGEAGVPTDRTLGMSLVGVMDSMAMPVTHERLLHAGYLLERIRPGTLATMKTDALLEDTFTDEQFAALSPSTPIHISSLRHIHPEAELAACFLAGGLRHNARFNHAIGGIHYRYGSCPIYIEDFVDARFTEGEDEQDQGEDTDDENAPDFKADRADHHKSKRCIFDTRLDLEMKLVLGGGEALGGGGEEEAAASRMHFEVLGRMALHHRGDESMAPAGGNEDEQPAPSTRVSIRMGAGLLLRFINFLYRWLRRNRVDAELSGISSYDSMFSELLARGRGWAREHGVRTVDQLMGHALTVDSFMAFLHIEYGGIMLYDRVAYTLAQVNDHYMRRFQHTSQQLHDLGKDVHTPYCAMEDDTTYWAPMMNERMCTAFVDSLKINDTPGMINLFKLCSLE